MTSGRRPCGVILTLKKKKRGEERQVPCNVESLKDPVREIKSDMPSTDLRKDQGININIRNQKTMMKTVNGNKKKKKRNDVDKGPGRHTLCQKTCKMSRQNGFHKTEGGKKI